jgi:AraC family transcriptional regulator
VSDAVVNPAVSPCGDCNVVLTGEGRHYYVGSFPGPLSVKSMVHGKAAWTVDGGRFEVGADSLLVLNDRQIYTIEINSPRPAQTFCLFFKTGLVEQAWRCHTVATTTLLAEPDAPPPLVGFFERLHPKTGLLANVLEAMHCDVAGGVATAESLDDGFLLATRELLRFREELLLSVARVPAMRNATRTELFRRLTTARSMIEDSLDQPLGLDRIASAACLSPYHLHRLFTQVFGETPHRYVVRRRIARAKRLLARTDAPVNKVCVESGFQSLGSFSTLFRKETGYSPQQYRLSTIGRC